MTEACEIKNKLSLPIMDSILNKRIVNFNFRILQGIQCQIREMLILNSEFSKGFSRKEKRTVS